MQKFEIWYSRSTKNEHAVALKLGDVVKKNYGYEGG